MDPTVSASRGVFVFNNGFKFKTGRGEKARKTATLFEKCFSVEPWYESFKKNWNDIEHNLQCLNLKTYNSVLSNIVDYIKECYSNKEIDVYENIIPSATLLTGVNQPDHLLQFSALTDKIRSEVTPHIATVHSQDAPSLRHLVESAVWQLVNAGEANTDVSYEGDESMESPRKNNLVKKSHCTIMALKQWYSAMYSGQKLKVQSPKKKRKREPTTNLLVVIIPDFESFNCEVLQDFVTIVSSYTSTLPIVLVFGVATSVSALHKSFPYHVSSKLLIKVFQSHSSTAYLNQVLEEVFLTHTCPFHLSGRAFELFTDVFLFYDFSVTGFTQSIKYCMMDHYYGDNTKSLCCGREDIPSAIASLSPDELEEFRRLASFRPYVEAQDCRTRISLLEDDEFLRAHLEKCLNDFHDYLFSFHTTLRVLYAFVKGLPKNILGKQLREFYARCTSEVITNTTEFNECIQLLNFQSKSNVIDNLTSAIRIVNAALQSNPTMKNLNLSPLKKSPYKKNAQKSNENSAMVILKIQLTAFLRQIQHASLDVTFQTAELGEDENAPVLNRQKLKEKLLKATKTERLQSEFEMIRSRLTEYLVETFTDHLKPPYLQTFHEIFVFNDVASVKKQIVGAPRGAVHTALNNPVAYLQCSCCELPAPDSIAQTLPDVSVAYKLHLECGKLINLYDWLQAFVCVLEPDAGEEEEERRHVSPQTQARFTRAVSELQFLGFIKASKRKTDHVTRLTW